jgi:hypothetical protein
MEEAIAEIKVLKLRIENAEKGLMDTKLDVKQTQSDIHKILNQLSAVKYTLIGIIVAESPQAVEAIMSILGVR